MNQKNNNRRSGRHPETPQRVMNAAEQIRNTASYGNLRGYVPQQSGNPKQVRNMNGRTGSQPPVYGSPAQQRVQPPAYHAVPQNTGEFRGFGKPAVQEEPKKKRNIWLILLILLIIAGIIAGGTSYGIRLSKEAEERKVISDKVTPYDGLFCPGVYVNGIHLGGMTPEQALNSVQSQISQSQSEWSIKLMYQGSEEAVINSDMLKMNLNESDLYSLLNEAWKQGHTGTQADRYGQMEELEKNPYSVYTDKPSGDTSQIDMLLEALKQRIDRPAKDAACVAFDLTRAYPFVITEEQTGLNLDIATLKEKLYKMESTMTSGTVELEPEIILPGQTVEDVKKHFALRGQATTPIDRHSEEGRNNNIRRCFELISGTIIDPGKSFSFNKIVGDRTYENGFYDATEYINDEHVIGVGGGACQASTTVYQAAVRAGLQITSRRPHSDSVSYAEYGKDATVYMGGKQIDLVFKNNTDEKIYITAEVLNDPKNKGREMTKVCIYGTDLGNIKYELETETVETLPSIMEPVYVNDKESAAKAKDGCVVDSYRVTYINGVPTAREPLFHDTYKPKPEKIYQPSFE